MNKILIIDDEEANVRVLSMSLKSDGYEVVTAFSGEEGLEVFEKAAPDIVLTDIKMPGIDGIEVLKKIKEKESDAEVIIITGHGDIDNAVEALKYGASDFLNKPIRDEALSVALKRAQEKLEIKKRLKEHTNLLEQKVKEATRNLRRQSNFLGKLIRSSNDGIIATDNEFYIVIYNPGAERIFGYSPSEVIGIMNALDIYPKEISDFFRLNMLAEDDTAQLPWIETTVTSKDQTQIPVRFSGTLLHENKQIMGSVAFFQDLREIKRLEKELIRTEKLAAVGQTVAGLAHCIKNILQGFKSGMFLVDIGLENNKTDKLKDGWQMIKRNIGRTSDLVMDLLSYSKEREPEYEECFPNEVANDVCELLMETAKQNHIEIIKDFDPSIGKMIIDPRATHRVLLNLMSNAVDACLFDENTTKHWAVCLKTEKEPNHTIRFQVIDNGMGMSDEVKEKLFTSFFSTKGYRGTGLGLLVTRKIVDEHNGSIEVQSELGVGTSFTIRFPYKDAPSSDGKSIVKLKDVIDSTCTI